MSEAEGTFLGRWSRRKALRQQELDDDAIQGDLAHESEPAPQDAARPAADPVKPLTDEDMPPIDSLGEDDDFSGFLSPEVSDKLRKVALRKLFHGAAFNVRDGLCEYDEDYTSFEPLGDIVTADMRHQQEMLERKAREAAEREQELAGNATAEDSEMSVDEGQAESESDSEDREDQKPPIEAAGDIDPSVEPKEADHSFEVAEAGGQDSEEDSDPPKRT